MDPRYWWQWSTPRLIDPIGSPHEDHEGRQQGIQVHEHGSGVVEVGEMVEQDGAGIVAGLSK
jgi:hypothetical protein